MPDTTPSLSDGSFFCPIGPCKHKGKIHVCDFSGQRVINIDLEVFGERCSLVWLAINNFKNIGIIIVHDRMHFRLVHSKVCDKRCPVMHSKGEKTPRCLGSKDITSFKVCFNFIVVLPLTIGNNYLCVVLLARRIHPPFDNGSSTVKSFVHILVQVLDGRYGRTYLHVDVHVVLGCQVKIVPDNPSTIHHALRLWIYKNAGLTTPVLGVLVNITMRFFAKGTQVPFLHFPCSMHYALRKYGRHGPCTMHEVTISHASGWRIGFRISANTIKL